MMLQPLLQIRQWQGFSKLLLLTALTVLVGQILSPPSRSPSLTARLEYRTGTVGHCCGTQVHHHCQPWRC